MKMFVRPLRAADGGLNPQEGASPKADKKNTGPAEETTKPANALQSKSVTHEGSKSINEELVIEIQRLVRRHDEKSVRDISTQIIRLLTANANPNTVDQLGAHTAFGLLLESLENEKETETTLRLKLELVQLMLNKGAKINHDLAKTSKGKNLVHLLAYHSDKQEKRNTVHSKIDGRYLDDVVKDALSRIEDLEPGKRKELEAQAYMKAREKYESQLFLNRVLLERLEKTHSKDLGVLLTETDERGSTPLHYAAEHTNTRRFISTLIKSINKFASNPEKVRNAQTPSGYTAADLAYEARNGNGNYRAMLELRSTAHSKQAPVELNIYNKDEVALFLQAGWPEYYQEAYPGKVEQEAKERAKKGS